MNLKNMEVVNTRISEAVASGRLDPDQVPANLEDIKALQPKQKKAFFEAVYPVPVTEEIAAMLQAGKQLPEEDLQMLRMMPLSLMKTLPDVLQRSIELDIAITTLTDSLDRYFDDATKKAGITRDEFKRLLDILNNDIDAHPEKYNTESSILDADMNGLMHYMSVIRPLLSQEHVSSKTMAIYTAPPLRNMLKLTTDRQNIGTADYADGSITVTDKHGNKTIVKDYNDLQWAIGTEAKKLLDYIMIEYTKDTYDGTDHPIPLVDIDMMKYWRLCDEKVDIELKASINDQDKEKKRVDYLIKNLRKAATRSITAIRDHLRFEGVNKPKKMKQKKGIDTEINTATQQETGKESRQASPSKSNNQQPETVQDSQDKKYPYSFSYISGLEWKKNNHLEITLDYKMAQYLVNKQPISQYYLGLFRHEGRDANSYSIGRKICEHHCMKSNIKEAKNNTLAVKSLLNSAPEIISYDDLRIQNRRDWKSKIKDKLERALNRNISIAHVLKKWEYRDPVTNMRYTAESASDLTWAVYYRLMVDFIMEYEPDEYLQKLQQTADSEE